MMSSDPVQFSVATSLLLRGRFRPIEELYRVHKGKEVLVGMIEFTLDGQQFMGELYNTDIVYMWGEVIATCRELMETGQPASRTYEWGGALELRYAGWERSHVELRLLGKKQFHVPSVQFMRVTIEGGLHALRLIEKHFPKSDLAPHGRIAIAEEALRLAKE